MAAKLRKNPVRKDAGDADERREWSLSCDCGSGSGNSRKQHIWQQNGRDFSYSIEANDLRARVCVSHTDRDWVNACVWMCMCVFVSVWSIKAGRLFVNGTHLNAVWLATFSFDKWNVKIARRAFRKSTDNSTGNHWNNVCMCCGCVCVCLGIELGQSSAGQGKRLPAAQTRSGPINRDEKAQLLLRFITYLCTCSDRSRSNWTWFALFPAGLHFWESCSNCRQAKQLFLAQICSRLAAPLRGHTMHVECGVCGVFGIDGQADSLMANLAGQLAGRNWPERKL